MTVCETGAVISVLQIMLLEVRSVMGFETKHQSKKFYMGNCMRGLCIRYSTMELGRQRRGLGRRRLRRQPIDVK